MSTRGRRRRAATIRADRTIRSENVRMAREFKARRIAKQNRDIAKAQAKRVPGEPIVKGKPKDTRIGWSNRKILAVSVGGFLALAAIGNAIVPQHSHTPKTHPVAAVVATGKIHHHVAAYKGNCNPYKCYAPCRHTAYSNPACDRAGKLYDRKRHAREAVAEHKWEKHLKAQEVKDEKQSSNDSCSSDAAALAAVEALSGNVGDAVGAGKLALATAGTGAKC